MGCAPSSIGPLWHSKSFLNPLEFLTRSNNIMELNTPEKDLIGRANSNAAGASVIDISQSSTPRDVVGTKPPPAEQGDFELPVGSFIDGKLGTTDEKTINDIKSGLRPGELFVDTDFPPDETSLFFTDNSEPDIKWKRPHEIVENPQLFVKGVDRRDVLQGDLGDCWFLSSCSAVARTPKLIEKVIPKDQTLFGEDYHGLVLVRFWRFGTWTTVLIDDLLPTKKGSLLYAHSEDVNEFWVALLEKAYAKLHGTYQALGGGQSMDAMVDLTGGLPERFDMEESPDQKKLYKYLANASKNGAFITASIKGDWKMANKANADGLVEGHAYTVSGVSLVTHQKLGTVPLVRIRNPWGNEAEWKGAWSDGDVLWDHVPNDMKVKLLMDDKDDGEFWMSFKDFHKEFEEVSLCRLGPDFDKDGDVDGEANQVRCVDGAWVAGKSAGGSRNNFKLFATNPQILLTMEDAANDDDDDEEEDGYDEVEKIGTQPVLVGLMQEHRLSKRDEGVDMNQIGFCVYKAGETTTRLPLMYFMNNYDIGTSGTYINYREVICRLDLKPGNYIIIPATFKADTEGQFMIRAYCPKKFSLRNLN